MAMPLVARMRARSAFSAGVAAGKTSTDPFVKGRVAMRKAGVTSVGGGYFYKRGVDFARRNQFGLRSESMALTAAMDDYEADRKADVELMIAELTTSDGIDFGDGDRPDAADVLGDASDDESELDIVDDEDDGVDDPGDFDPGDCEDEAA